jgi:signal transduction histidine kinase
MSPQSRLAREPRWIPAVTVGPYALLAVLVVFTAVSERSKGRPLLVDMALCALAAVWMLGMFTLRPARRERPVPMAVFFTVLVAIIAVLVVRHPWFGCFTPALYLYAFRVLRWPWELPGVAAVAVLSGTAQAYGVDKSSLGGVLVYLGVVVMNVLPMTGFAWGVRRWVEQEEEREQALAELSEANRRLEVTAAENAVLHEQLLAQAREAGVMDERQRMAREIHDTLAQGLTGIVTQLQAAEQVDDDPLEWRRHVRSATDLARESLTEARRSVRALRPEPLDTARLGEALADVAARWSARHGVAVQVTTTGTVRPVRPEAEVALLRTAQEALANVARHAGATRVGVTLSYLEQEVALDVRDDGAGFDPSQSAAAVTTSTGGGFGLIAMRQRIEGLAGTLQIESEPLAGTAISARVPVTT